MENNNDFYIFSEELLNLVPSKRQNYAIFNPFINTTIPKIRLYGFSGVFNAVYFDTEEELIEYAKNNKSYFGDICIIEYLGDVASKTDVFRKVYRDGTIKIISVTDSECYETYDYKKSLDEDRFIWKSNFGPKAYVHELEAFKERGIKLKNDAYNLTLKK